MCREAGKKDITIRVWIVRRVSLLWGFFARSRPFCESVRAREESARKHADNGAADKSYRSKVRYHGLKGN